MRVVISGASRGIGRAIANEFNKEDHQILLLSRGERELLQLTEELNSKRKKAGVECISVDLSDESQTLALKKLPFFQKSIDLLVNNLGQYWENSVEKIDLNDLKKAMEVNLYSSIMLTDMVLPSMIKNQAGLVVNIGSVMSIKAEQYASIYSISKHALKAWNDALRERLRQKGIQVSAIYPGSVNTSSWKKEQLDVQAMIQPEDVAKLVISLSKLSPSCLVEEIRLSPLNFNPGI